MSHLSYVQSHTCVKYHHTLSWWWEWSYEERVKEMYVWITGSWLNTSVRGWMCCQSELCHLGSQLMGTHTDLHTHPWICWQCKRIIMFLLRVLFDVSLLWSHWADNRWLFASVSVSCLYIGLMHPAHFHEILPLLSLHCCCLCFILSLTFCLFLLCVCLLPMFFLSLPPYFTLYVRNTAVC